MLTAAAGSRRTSSTARFSAARECASSAMREASSPVTNIPLPSLILRSARAASPCSTADSTPPAQYRRASSNCPRWDIFCK